MRSNQPSPCSEPREEQEYRFRETLCHSCSINDEEIYGSMHIIKNFTNGDTSDNVSLCPGEPEMSVSDERLSTWRPLDV